MLTIKSVNITVPLQEVTSFYFIFSSYFCCNFGTYCISNIQHFFSVTKIISSRPWTIQPKVKSTTAQKRTTVPTTTTTTTAAAAPQPETTKEVTEWRASSQPEVIAVTLMGKVENTGKELEWLSGGKGVTWIEMDDEEKQVKGSAVVMEVKEEVVTQPRTIFEDIFEFDK